MNTKNTKKQEMKVVEIDTEVLRIIKNKISQDNERVLACSEGDVEIYLKVTGGGGYYVVEIAQGGEIKTEIAWNHRIGPDNGYPSWVGISPDRKTVAIFFAKEDVILIVSLSELDDIQVAEYFRLCESILTIEEGSFVVEDHNKMA